MAKRLDFELFLEPVVRCLKHLQFTRHFTERRFNEPPACSHYNTLFFKVKCMPSNSVSIQVENPFRILFWRSFMGTRRDLRSPCKCSFLDNGFGPICEAFGCFVSAHNIQQFVRSLCFDFASASALALASASTLVLALSSCPFVCVCARLPPVCALARLPLCVCACLALCVWACHCVYVCARLLACPCMCVRACLTPPR